MFDLDLLITAGLHELYDLRFEVFVLRHNVEVLLLHHLVISNDFLGALLSLFVLGQPAHQDLVVELKLLELFGITSFELGLVHGLF